jgi:FkbM family methyltransferase
VAAEPSPSPLSALAALVVESDAFLVAEGASPGTVAEYRLRGAPLSVALRHGTTDVGVFDEIFGWRFYEPPAAVAEVLGSLAGPPRVLDLGAHVGLSGVYLLATFPGARIVSFEPDRLNFALLDRCRRLNGAADWTLVASCAGNRDGEVGFVESGDAQSCMAEDARVRVSVRDVLPLLADTDLLKLDMEGGEWAILEDGRFAALAPPVTVLEYHPQRGGGRAAGARAEALLARAGYVVEHLFEKADGVGMLWAWRPRGCS